MDSFLRRVLTWCYFNLDPKFGERIANIKIGEPATGIVENPATLSLWSRLDNYMKMILKAAIESSPKLASQILDISSSILRKFVEEVKSRYLKDSTRGNHAVSDLTQGIFTLFKEIVQILIANDEQSEFIATEWIGSNGDGLLWMLEALQDSPADAPKTAKQSILHKIG